MMRFKVGDIIQWKHSLSKEVIEVRISGYTIKSFLDGNIIHTEETGDPYLEEWKKSIP